MTAVRRFALAAANSSRCYPDSWLSVLLPLIVKDVGSESHGVEGSVQLEPSGMLILEDSRSVLLLGKFVVFEAEGFAGLISARAGSSCRRIDCLEVLDTSVGQRLLWPDIKNA